MNAERSTPSVPPCEAWVTLRSQKEDPLSDFIHTTRIWGEMEDEIWEQVQDFEKFGYSVLRLEGINRGL